MCGIVGCIGGFNAVPFLLGGLSKLEYRGYDSAGIAVLTKQNKIETVKSKGRLSVLCEKTEPLLVCGNIGIGHTRWATHGVPSDINSHPHLSRNGKIAVVHNGIIENYIQLKTRLEALGFEFVSETDTETVAHLLEYYYSGDMTDAIIKAAKDIEGSYALGIINTDCPDELYAIKKDSPLIVGIGKNENYIASDIPAVLDKTREIYLLEDGEIVRFKTDGSIKITDCNKNEIKKEIFHVNWDISAAEKGGYDHFMLKEIHEQPRAVRDTVFPRIYENNVVFEDFSLTDEEIRGLNKIHIVACGSAYHTGVVGKYTIEKLARIPVEADLASEFRYRSPIIGKNDLVVIISQSGETADTLAALREAKRQGAKVVSVVNVVGSSIARESDSVIYTWAGPEIAVATTKAYSAQLQVLFMLGIYLADKKGLLSPHEKKTLTDELVSLPDKIEEILKKEPELKALAYKLKDTANAFFIGRNSDYGASMEGSLKLKEISYIHSEAYAAGELKHGTISLIEDGTLVFALATQSGVFEKMLSNIKEVRTRGANVVAIVCEGAEEIEKEADTVIYIPKTADIFSPALTVIPMQIFAYYISVFKGCDVDKPRNLAKSVTVE